ncbi:unnamed protein product [Lepeophtheirus salmonis]|uniref:(salmon louse) hypothetical protein n=1 Tax=Lepeophtheirus salmonis TaxID=72036 RepID=A0A7R8D0R3_LEPSM|nr:unnamed protein product [Lepeophtheirus salmonis]CAF2986275.1 unnamed protein product [Lepeophtheirus salmonis]
MGKKAGVVIKLIDKVQDENGGGNFWTFQCIWHQEFDNILRHCNIINGVSYKTEVRCLSKGDFWYYFVDLRCEIFMGNKVKPVKELQCPLWLQYLGLMINITEHLLAK